MLHAAGSGMLTARLGRESALAAATAAAAPQLAAVPPPKAAAGPPRPQSSGRRRQNARAAQLSKTLPALRVDFSGTRYSGGEIGAPRHEDRRPTTAEILHSLKRVVEGPAGGPEMMETASSPFGGGVVGEFDVREKISSRVGGGGGNSCDKYEAANRYAPPPSPEAAAARPPRHSGIFYP